MPSLVLRRIFPRTVVHRIVSYKHGGRRFLTLTLDLGLGGMKIGTHSDLSKDESLEFKLMLGDDCVRVKGRVVYSSYLSDNRSISGIEFIELSADDHIALQEHLVDLKALPRPRGMVSVVDNQGIEIGGRDTGVKKRRTRP
jgi:hypothetical protein